MEKQTVLKLEVGYFVDGLLAEDTLPFILVFLEMQAIV